MLNTPILVYDQSRTFHSVIIQSWTHTHTKLKHTHKLWSARKKKKRNLLWLWSRTTTCCVGFFFGLQHMFYSLLHGGEVPVKNNFCTINGSWFSLSKNKNVFSWWKRCSPNTIPTQHNTTLNVWNHGKAHWHLIRLLSLIFHRIYIWTDIARA